MLLHGDFCLTPSTIVQKEKFSTFSRLNDKIQEFFQVFYAMNESQALFQPSLEFQTGVGTLP